MLPSLPDTRFGCLLATATELSEAGRVLSAPTIFSPAPRGTLFCVVAGRSSTPHSSVHLRRWPKDGEEFFFLLSFVDAGYSCLKGLPD